MNGNSKLNIASKGNGQWLIHGELTFASIHGQLVDSPPFLRGNRDIILDFSQVTNTDSAGLALMIEWIKITRHQHAQLHFRNVPKQLLNLAKLSGLDKTHYFSLKLKKPTETHG
ncbi:MAG: STAS domain-containing protein [Methylococcales bacterium]|nr:STAS domain-containing protein [Methylococcales bacterium]MDD5754613.1 STAS domain-containing protein [Methylococcales bacterium]